MSSDVFFRLEAKNCPVVVAANVSADLGGRTISILPVSIIIFRFDLSSQYMV